MVSRRCPRCHSHWAEPSGGEPTTQRDIGPLKGSTKAIGCESMRIDEIDKETLDKLLAAAKEIYASAEKIGQKYQLSKEHLARILRALGR